MKDEHADIAASAQNVFEKIIFNKINYLHKETKIDKACFSGGCFFNSKMAGKIKYNTALKDIYIGSNPGDAGGAVGSALYLSNKLENNLKLIDRDKISYSFIYDELEENKSFNKFQNKIEIKKFKNNEELVDSASDILKLNKIISWFQSSSEWGPKLRLQINFSKSDK